MKRWTLPLLLILAQQATAAFTISHASGPIVLDGELNDEGWKGATVLDHFYEYQKSDNVPPPVATVAWITIDEHYLYVGVRCDDPDPSKIRAPYVDRDHVLGDQDNVALIIDARGEGKAALQFRVNPRGIQGDAVDNDASGSEDYAPDFFYDTAAKITSTGWNAEYRIPLATFRYANGKGPQTWGLIVIRNYPRDFRYDISSTPLPRNSNCFICHAEKMSGMTDLPSSQHLTIAPYVTAQQTQRPEVEAGGRFRNDPFRTETGGDVKWSPTSDTTIDATLNPDFSQIESDVAQISTNQRFALFFAEKRPFFLEGSDLLQTPIQAIYTRTITSPRWGIRATGRTGRTAWTMLLADDRGGGSIVLPGPLGSDFAPQDFKTLIGIGRSRTELEHGAVGALFSTRENDGGGYNRVAGPDFEWRPTELDQVTGQLLISKTENPDRPDLSPSFSGTTATSHAARLNWSHTAKDYDWYGTYQDFGDHFRADNGYVPQVGFREEAAGAGLNFFPAAGAFVQHRGYANSDTLTGTDGRLLLQDQWLGYAVRGSRNLTASFDMHVDSRVRGNGGNLISQTYLHYNIALNPTRWFPNLAVVGDLGNQADFSNSRAGRSYSADTTATFRPSDRLQTEVEYNHQRFSVRGQRLFDAEVERLKVTYSFSAKSLLRVIGQYVDVTRAPALYQDIVPRHDGTFLATVLYSYKLNWQTVLFAGYGDDRLVNERADLVPADRTLFLKVSYAFQR